MAELCTFYSRHLFCGVWYPAEQHPAGSDTSLNKVLRGIRPCGTKSCGVSNPAEQHSKTNISPNSKKNSKIFQGVNSGTIWGRFMEKTRGQKSRATLPLMWCYWIDLGEEMVTSYAVFLFYIILTIILEAKHLRFWIANFFLKTAECNSSLR